MNVKSPNPTPDEPLRMQFDHPLWSEWWQTNTATVNPSVLADRFEGTGEDIEALGRAVDRATMQMAAWRFEKQRENEARLPTVSQAESERHRSLARDVLTIGEYAKWFLRVAQGAFRNPANGRVPKRISLELGGKLQRGDWEGAKAVDDLEYDILPEQLAVAGLTLLKPNKLQMERSRSYTLMPMIDPDESPDPIGFNYALLSRFRDAWYVQDEEGRRMRVVKRSVALVVMSQLSPADQQAIRKQFAKDGIGSGIVPDNKAARIVGRIFDIATDKKFRNQSTQVVPISANLLAVVDAPEG